MARKVLTRNRIEAIMGLTFLGMWLVGELIFQLLIPQYYFTFFPVIAIIFLLFSLINTCFIKRWEKKLYSGEITHAKAFNYFMIGKMVKLLVCVVVMFCYIKFIGVNTRVFLVCFMLFYLVFVGMETLAQTNFEKRYKLKKEEQ